MQCVSQEIFYQRLDDFKQKQKRNTSQLTMFIEDQFYNEAMEYLKIQIEKSSSDSRETEGKLSLSQLKTLQRKKWTYHQGKLQTPDRKTVIPKSKLYDTLILAHQRTAHRGRQITSKCENDNYSEVSVQLVKLYPPYSKIAKLYQFKLFCTGSIYSVPVQKQQHAKEQVGYR